MQATKANGQQIKHAIADKMNSIVILELYSSRVYRVCWTITPVAGCDNNNLQVDLVTSWLCVHVCVCVCVRMCVCVCMGICMASILLMNITYT